MTSSDEMTAPVDGTRPGDKTAPKKEKPREEEIAELEDELQHLRRRYAQLERAGRKLRLGFYILVALTVIGLTFGLLSLQLGLIALSLVVACLLIAPMAIWCRNKRWVDLATASGTAQAYDILKESEAQAIEERIAEHTAKLESLRS